MIEKLRSGYEIMLKAWEQYQAGLGYEITEGDWKASVNYDGKYLCLSGSGLIFLFSVQSLAEQLLPVSNYFDDEGLERLIKEKAFGDLTLEEVENGLSVAVKAWELYENDSTQIYEKGEWKASVLLFENRSCLIEYILLAGYKKIFLLPTNALNESNTLIAPVYYGEEFSGIINLINQELISKGENPSFTKTLWPKVLVPRLLMLNTARYVDIIKNNKATKSEKAILDLGYNDLSNTEAQKILCRKSDIKFSETLRQIETIKDYSAELADTYSDTALINSKQLRHDDKVPPIIYFINEPEVRVLAQMCIWTYRRSLKERELEAKGYDDIRKAIPFLEINVFSIHEENDIVAYLINYIKKLKVANVSQKYRQENVHDITGQVIQRWHNPKLGISLDAFIIATIKALYRESSNEAVKQKKIADRIKRTNEPNNNHITEAEINNIKKHEHNFMTVDEAVDLLFEQEDFIKQYPSESESLRRWIYSQMKKGKIRDVGRKRQRHVREGIYEETYARLLDKESISQIKKYFKDKDQRKAMVEYLTSKGISERGARKRIKENLDKGISIEELAIKVSTE